MPQQRRPASQHRRRDIEQLHPQVRLAAMVVTTAAPLALLALLVPRPLVLPVLCLIALAAAALAALVAWHSVPARQCGRVTAWDVAGAAAFIGFAAAILSDVDRAIPHIVY